MKITDFHRPKTDTFRFDALGDAADGVIIGEPQLTDDAFKDGAKVMAIKLSNDDGERMLFARNHMLDAIGEAVTAAGVEEIEEGAALRVEYVKDRTLRNGRTMKIYAAEYVPPQPMGVAELGGADMWGGNAVVSE